MRGEADGDTEGLDHPPGRNSSADPRAARRSKRVAATGGRRRGTSDSCSSWMAPRTIVCSERQISCRASASTNCCSASRTRTSSMPPSVIRIHSEAASTDQIAAPGTRPLNSQLPAPKSRFTSGRNCARSTGARRRHLFWTIIWPIFALIFTTFASDAAFADCLDPVSYGPSQRLARDLLADGSAGIVYPSVRRFSGHVPGVLPAGSRHQCQKRRDRHGEGLS